MLNHTDAGTGIPMPIRVRVLYHVSRTLLIVLRILEGMYQAGPILLPQLILLQASCFTAKTRMLGLCCQNLHNHQSVQYSDQWETKHYLTGYTICESKKIPVHIALHHGRATNTMRVYYHSFIFISLQSVACANT